VSDKLTSHYTHAPNCKNEDIRMFNAYEIISFIQLRERN